LKLEGGPEWNELSVDAQRLIKQLIEKNPEKRLSAQEALESSFFRTKN